MEVRIVGDCASKFQNVFNTEYITVEPEICILPVNKKNYGCLFLSEMWTDKLHEQKILLSEHLLPSSYSLFVRTSGRVAIIIENCQADYLDHSLVHSVTKLKFSFDNDEREAFIKAILLLQLLLGREWLDRVWGLGKKNNIFNYIKTTDSATSTLRTVQLANSLYSLQDCKGFTSNLLKLRSIFKEQLEDTLIELFLANLIKSNVDYCELVVETGVKGSDFDLIVSKGSDRAAIELKCKRDTGQFSRSRFSKILSNAKDQMKNADFAQIIVIWIPSNWLESSIDSELQEVITAFLGRSTNVSAIITTAVKMVKRPCK